MLEYAQKTLVSNFESIYDYSSTIYNEHANTIDYLFSGAIFATATYYSSPLKLNTILAKSNLPAYILSSSAPQFILLSTAGNALIHFATKSLTVTENISGKTKVVLDEFANAFTLTCLSPIWSNLYSQAGGPNFIHKAAGIATVFASNKFIDKVINAFYAKPEEIKQQFEIIPTIAKQLLSQSIKFCCITDFSHTQTHESLIGGALSYAARAKSIKAIFTNTYGKEELLNVFGETALGAIFTSISGKIINAGYGSILPISNIVRATEFYIKEFWAGPILTTAESILETAECLLGFSSCIQDNNLSLENAAEVSFNSTMIEDNLSQGSLIQPTIHSEL